MKRNILIAISFISIGIFLAVLSYILFTNLFKQSVFEINPNRLESLLIDINFKSDISGEFKLNRESVIREETVLNDKVEIYSKNNFIEYRTNLLFENTNNKSFLIVEDFSGNDSFIEYLGEKYDEKKEITYDVYAESIFESYFGYPYASSISDLINTSLKVKKISELNQDKEFINLVLDEVLDIHSSRIIDSQTFDITYDRESEVSRILISFENVEFEKPGENQFISGKIEYLLSDI